MEHQDRKYEFEYQEINIADIAEIDGLPAGYLPNLAFVDLRLPYRKGKFQIDAGISIIRKIIDKYHTTKCIVISGVPKSKSLEKRFNDLNLNYHRYVYDYIYKEDKNWQDQLKNLLAYLPKNYELGR
jgi:hypothetical protein